MAAAPSSRPARSARAACEAAFSAAGDAIAAVRQSKGTATVPFEIGISLHFGTPAYGNVGSGRRLDFTVVGRDVNIASRITAEAVPGMIQVDATTYRRLRGKFDFDPPHTVYLKGKGDTVIYRLSGRKVEQLRAVAAG